MILVDDYRRIFALWFLKNKSEELKSFKTYKEMLEIETGLKIKCLRSNNGGEFTSKEFMDFCSEHGIKRQLSVARTPKKNGVVERKKKTLQEMVRTMIMDSNLTDVFWAQAVNPAVHIQNRGILISKNDNTPYELWKGRLVNVKNFRVFGRKCYIKGEDDMIKKFDSRVNKGILVGYSTKRK